MRSPGLLTFALAVSAVGCLDNANPFGPEKAQPKDTLRPPPLHLEMPQEPVELAIATYDGSGQATEPDVIYFANAWRGWEYWMVVTPYPYANGRYENASIYVSHDGKAWFPPAGLTNPIFPTTVGTNSDPSLLYDEASERLVAFNRRVSGGFDLLEYKTSLDGVHWDATPRISIQISNYSAISPNVVRLRQLNSVVATRLWLVDANHGCGTDSTAITLRYGNDTVDFGNDAAGSNWSAPAVTSLNQPGQVIWHLAVKYVPSKAEYWAIYPAYPKGARSCAKDDLFFATSKDGTTWRTFRRPVLTHGFAPWAAVSLYKSTFFYDSRDELLKVWFSSFGAGYTSHVGFVSFRYSALLGYLQAP